MASSPQQPRIPYLTDEKVRRTVPPELIAAIQARRGGTDGRQQDSSTGDHDQTNNALSDRDEPAPLAILELDRILLHSPPIAAGWNDFFARIRGSGNDGLELSAYHRELAMCVVGILNRASYESYQHEPLFLEAGGTRAQLQVLHSALTPSTSSSMTTTSTNDEILLNSDVWNNDADRAVLNVIIQCTRGVKIENEAFEAARRAFNGESADRLLLELVTVTAAYNMVSRVLVAFNVQAPREK
jgi:alkylhydroperoxidase family enzyme